MHYHSQNLQLTAQLARALAIHSFSYYMGRKFLCPPIMHWQPAAVSNRRHSAPFNQKPCNPRAQETEFQLCMPLLSYSQDRTLILRTRPTFKSSSPFYFLNLPSEALAFITGGAMASGHQHSTTMATKAKLPKKEPKVQKKRKKMKINNLIMKQIKRHLKLNTF